MNTMHVDLDTNFMFASASKKNQYQNFRCHINHVVSAIQWKACFQHANEKKNGTCIVVNDPVATLHQNEFRRGKLSSYLSNSRKSIMQCDSQQKPFSPHLSTPLCSCGWWSSQWQSAHQERKRRYYKSLVQGNCD